MNVTEIIFLVLGLGAGLLGTKALSLIASYAGKGKQIAVELSEAFAETADVFGAIDEAIKNDNKIDGNEVKDILAKGKEAVVAFKDVVISVKPIK